MLYTAPVSNIGSKGVRNNRRIVIYLVIYKICLDAVYFEVLTGLYSYAGYRSYWNVGSCLISWMITIVYILVARKLFNKTEHRLSDCIMIFLILITAFPSTTMIGAGIFSNQFVILNTIFWIFIISLQIYVSKKRIAPITVKMGNTVFNDKIIYVFAIISFLLVLFINLRYTHFRISFDLSDAYDLRAQAREYSFPTLLRYGFSWSRAINNCMIAYCLNKKKHFTAVLFIIAQILSFSIDGLKSTLFLPIIIIGINILYYRRKDAKFFNYVINIVSGVCVLGVLEKIFFHTANITLIFVRRVFFTPVLLNSYYADFFSKNTPVYYRTTFGFRSPYTELGKMIGGMYANRPNMNCNNGVFGDAMINFGFAGIIIFPILLILVLRVVDKCSHGIDKLIIIPIAYYFATTLTNSVITTAFGTHGLMILTILFLLMRSKGEENYSKMERL